MEIPGYGITDGDWDLRKSWDDYLGRVPLAGQRVLEIGPASGFVTFEMEKRGASVVSVEVPEDPGWDFVPFPESFLEPIRNPRRITMDRLKNAYWFAHAAHRSNAKVLYGDVYNLPNALGCFDIAVMASVLLHCHSPLKIIEQCARRAATLVISDMFYPELEGKPVCRLAPTAENGEWHTWWHFSTDFFIQFLQVMGFRVTQVNHHINYHRRTPYTLFTIVASKPDAPRQGA